MENVKFIQQTHFKPTEIGEIPEEWEVVRLGELVTEKISGDWGNVSDKNEKSLIGCFVIRGTDFKNCEEGHFYKIPFRYFSVNSFEKRKLRNNDILIELSGGGPDQPTGRILVVTDHFLNILKNKVLFSNFVKLLKVNTTKVEPVFFYRYWQLLYNKGRTLIYEKRTTGIRNFKYNDFLEKEIIPLPPLSEQKAIAFVLSTIQEAKEKTERVIEATKNLKKSMMKHLFTYGPVSLKEAEKVKLKETEIGMIPEEWEVVEIKKIVERTRQKDMRKENTEFKYIDVSSIDRNNLRIISHTLHKGKDAPSRARKIIHKGDVIIATVRPTLKRIAKVGEEYDNEICSTAFCVLRAKKEVLNPDYLFYCVQQSVFIDNLSSIQRGASYPAVTDEDIKKQKIPFPPLPVQQKIAEILSAIDEKIQAEEKKKQAIENLFKSMLHNLMSGKIRLKNT